MRTFALDERPDLRERPPLSDYIAVTIILIATTGLLTHVARWSEGPPPAPGALIPPVVALVALTGLVLLITAVVRNLAVFHGNASARYYLDYITEAPDERIERPARTFNNSFQVPMLFYVACALMIATDQIDRTQVTLAWLYVAARVAHAIIYIAVNRIPYRFATYMASCIILGVLWTRFALQSWPSS